MRGAAALAGDLRFQVRHGLYTAYGVVTAFYVLLLLNLPVSVRPTATVIILFTDTSVLGFFFIGGMVLLERRQGVVAALFVTPLRPSEYLAAKTVSLTLLALVTSAVIMLAGGVAAQGFLVGAAGVVLTSLFFTLLGIVVVSRVETVNRYFFQGVLFSILFTLPLFDHLGLFTLPAERLLPTHGSLYLLDAMYGPAGPGGTLRAIAVLVIWCAVGWAWAQRSLDRRVIHRQGRAG